MFGKFVTLFRITQFQDYLRDLVFQKDVFSKPLCCVLSTRQWSESLSPMILNVMHNCNCCWTVTFMLKHEAVKTDT